MTKKNNIYFDVFLRTFLFYIMVVIFALGISFSIYMAMELKILAIIIGILLVGPLLAKTIYFVHFLFKFSDKDLTNVTEVKMQQSYVINNQLSKYKFTYMGKDYYTLAIFKNRNSGDYTVEKYQDKVLIAAYSKKYNEVFLFKK